MSSPLYGNTGDPQGREKALLGEVRLLQKRLERSRLAMRLLEEAKDRYDALYFNAITHLTETLELNETMLSAAPIGVAVFLASTGNCVMANAAYAAIIGAENIEQVLGENFRQTASWRRSGGLKVAERTLALGKVQRLEFDIRTTFNKRIWIDCVMAPFTSRSEKHLLIMMNETTERHLAEESLRHTQKMDSLALMAGGIAHDFNNLFQVMLSNLERLRAGRLGAEEADEVFTRVVGGLNRAQTLSAQMLDYSGKGLRVSRVLDLGHLVSENLPLLSRLAGREVVLAELPQGRSFALNGDPDILLQALSHLVVNAAEAMDSPAEPVRLSLSFLEDPLALSEGFWASPSPEGACLCLAVSDRGCGIPAEYLNRVCDPFFTTQEEGRGLGLSTTLGLLRGHGAGLHIESQVGLGTTFRALFAVGKPAVPETRRGALRRDASGPTTILVVDDDPDVRRSCQEILREFFGHQVLEARDGVDAVEVFQKHGDIIDLLIMDATMPRMGGGEAFAAIKKLQPDAKAILCSGYSDAMSQDAFQRHGFLMFLKKPYTIKELKHALDYALGVPLEL